MAIAPGVRSNSGTGYAQVRDRTDDTQSQRAHFRRLRSHFDEQLRNDLIMEHLWLAAHCARRFAHRGEPIEDLEQVAMVGLVKAVERFDPDVGAEFPSFAIPTMLGELRRHFRDATWALKVPRRLKDLTVRLGSATAELTATTGRAPTVDELADHIGCDADTVLEAMEAAAAYRTSEMEQRGREPGWQPEPMGVSEEVGYGQVDARITVDDLVQHLPERERLIVRLRFFHGLSQSEIGQRVGISQVHVSRLLSASLHQLQRRLAPEHTSDADDA